MKMLSLIKTLSWRIVGTVTTFVLVYLFTHSFDIAMMVCAVEILIKVLLYLVHERIWNNILPSQCNTTPFVLWFTGLSGSGKSTIADRVHLNLTKKGYNVARLDGDTVRSIFPDTGFSKDERNSHIKRIGYLASILEKNGVIVILSFVSPYAESRDFVRNLCRNFIEIYVSTSLEECERRDVKGLYQKARAGDIKNFTGIDDPYEPPLKPELIINTENKSLDQSVSLTMKFIKKYCIY